MKQIKKIGLLLVAVMFSLTLAAQKNYKAEADAAFKALQYYKAIDLYEKAYAKERKKDVKAEILFKIGEAYRLSDNMKQAYVWYNKALKAKYDNPIVIFYMAEAKRLNGDYEEAIVKYKEYLTKVPGDKKAEDAIKACELAKIWMDDPTRYVVEPQPLLNSEKYDFSPCIASKKGDVLYFTSTREGSTGNDPSDVTGMNFSDVYQSKRDKKGKWSEPILLEGEVNSPASEGAVCLNKRKNILYFTRCGVPKKGVMGCSIYWSKKTGQSWGTPELIPIASDTFAVGHPAISPDDNTLVFASDMPGGQGGKDLWYVVYDKKAKTWGEPVNLGPEINTEGDEMFPYIRDNGELYFASNGHIGMGGLDIFKAQSIGVNQWGKVENMKYPINSNANDFGIVFENGKDKGYLTTSREGGKGGDDIWSFYLPPLVFALEGIVKDAETGKPIPGAKIELVGSDGTKAEAIADENGQFKFAENGNDRYIKPNTTYNILVSAKDYLNAKGKETTVGVDKSKIFYHEYALTSTKKPIRMPQILYEYNKADLLPQSKDSLNFLYNVMMDNPNIVVELRSHTDFRGSRSYNQKLSQRRAQSAVDYLVKEKGIPADRIVAKGMGEDEPLVLPDGTVLDEKYIKSLKTKEEQEAAHQLNRRTDFKVIRTDYVPKEQPKTEGDSTSEGTSTSK
ncbi:MAG TPA: hypothetical protein DIU39_00240 [Flavobacteriales bacterium]|nr:hypothetical protein [Flavobacteriales bacterium]